jgi:hypothetical protein
MDDRGTVDRFAAHAHGFISLPNGPDLPTLVFTKYRKLVSVDKAAQTYSSPLTYI